MSRVRRGAVRDMALIALAVALVAFAVWYFLRYGSGEDPAPTDPSSFTYYVCEACGEFFHLDGRDVDQAFKKGEVGSQGRTLLFKCKKCGQIKGVRASKCPQHGDIIKDSPTVGDPVKCSKCNFPGSG